MKVITSNEAFSRMNDFVVSKINKHIEEAIENCETVVSFKIKKGFSSTVASVLAESYYQEDSIDGSSFVINESDNEKEVKVTIYI